VHVVDRHLHPALLRQSAPEGPYTLEHVATVAERRGRPTKV
jgi:hypothetical protein